ncbi:flagellar protein FlgN [Candidatus Magnetaquicoccus inordinatus]|uniref:flagellar protein FlgN n=1 Tax=Candidatus Magnetaquicoccus inordinatus TaxID=2496818 RepID=UPI00102CCE5E|nr:flagellar protein FlgN [Candidatus Magnetaquicoccus inordinatus]
MAESGRNPLDEELRQLRQILEPMVQQFAQLQELFLLEQEKLRQRDTDALDALAVQIAEKLARIRAIDQLRHRVTTQMGKRLGLKPEEVTLESLDKAMGGTTGLQALRTQLREVVEQTERINRENQAVLTGVLAATESILSALQGGPVGGVSSYNRLGSRQNNPRFNLLSRQL